jgi:hypothetical protein
VNARSSGLCDARLEHTRRALPPPTLGGLARRLVAVRRGTVLMIN